MKKYTAYVSKQGRLGSWIVNGKTLEAVKKSVRLRMEDKGVGLYNVEIRSDVMQWNGPREKLVEQYVLEVY